MSEFNQYTLLTNISYVVCNELRLHVSAIVIARDDSGYKSGPMRQKVRMFGPSSAWPICEVAVPVVPHSLIEHPPPDHLPEGARLVWRTYDLRFVDPDPARALSAGEVSRAPSFEISTNLMDGQPIVVREFPEGTEISEVWGALVPAVMDAWEAPYFPTLAYHSVESSRRP